MRQDVVRSNFRNVEFFDVIICDPPYGMRALTRKAGKRGEAENNSGEEEGGEMEAFIER
jgi:tRNA G10  N-methylase Trm11